MEINTSPFQITEIILEKFFRSEFLGGIGGISLGKYLRGILLTSQLQRFDKTNSEVNLCTGER